MSMTYSDAIASIKNNNWFRTRVEQATSKYTNYLLNIPASDPDYEIKTSAGTRLANSSQQAVDTLMFTLSGDTEVIEAGPAIPEPQLQAIVEKTLNKLYPMSTVSADGQIVLKYLPDRSVETIQ